MVIGVQLTKGAFQDMLKACKPSVATDKDERAALQTYRLEGFPDAKGDPTVRMITANGFYVTVAESRNIGLIPEGHEQPHTWSRHFYYKDLEKLKFHKDLNVAFEFEEGAKLTYFPQLNEYLKSHDATYPNYRMLLPDIDNNDYGRLTLNNMDLSKALEPIENMGDTPSTEPIGRLAWMEDKLQVFAENNRPDRRYYAEVNAQVARIPGDKVQRLGTWRIAMNTRWLSKNLLSLPKPKHREDFSITELAWGSPSQPVHLHHPAPWVKITKVMMPMFAQWEMGAFQTHPVVSQLMANAPPPQDVHMDVGAEKTACELHLVSILKDEHKTEDWLGVTCRRCEEKSPLAPPMHYGSEQFSAMYCTGALGGRATTVWEDVTCPKCIERKKYMEEVRDADKALASLA